MLKKRRLRMAMLLTVLIAVTGLFVITMEAVQSPIVVWIVGDLGTFRASAAVVLAAFLVGAFVLMRPENGPKANNVPLWTHAYTNGGDFSGTTGAKRAAQDLKSTSPVSPTGADSAGGIDCGGGGDS